MLDLSNPWRLTRAFSRVFPGLPKGGRFGRIKHRDYPELALQSLLGGL